MPPALAGAIGTATTVKPTSRTAGIEVPRDGEDREGRETQGLSIPLCMSGVILAGLLGLMSYRAWPQGWRRRQERQRDIDRLTAQFQALFRESDRGKNHTS